MALVGCTTVTTMTAAQVTQRNAENTRVKTLLIAQGDARSLMTAALLASSWAPGPPPLKRIADPDQWALAQRATALAPKDRALAWAKVALCARSSGCDDLGTARQFRAIDPANAAGWLPDLAAAAKHSTAAVTAVLTAMSRTTAFNLYFNQRVVEIADAYQQIGTTPTYRHSPGAMARLFAAGGLVAAQPVPALQELARACDEVHPDRNQACEAILATMARGDEDLIQSLAAEITIRRDAPDDPGRIAAQRLLRTSAWQEHLLGPIESAPFALNRRAAERLRLMALLPTEDEVTRALLRRHHRPLEPPAQWRPATG
ncbi:MAG: hypothetical protein ACREU2_10770 [Steroidobacteraceae bacterium]